MTWLERNRERVEAIREFVNETGSTAPSIFRYFLDGAEPRLPFPVLSDRGLGFLLFHCALFQAISEDELDRLLLDLFEEYGLDIFRLSRLPYLPLEAFFHRRRHLQGWTILQQAPGILRSVCDFFYKHGGPKALLEAKGWNSEHWVENVSEEVFLMGKSSATRFKARLSGCFFAIAGMGANTNFWNLKSLVPLSRGHLRFMRTVGPLSGRRRMNSEGWQETIDYHNRFYRVLFPSDTYRVFLPLDSFLKPMTGGGYRCKEIMGGCGRCRISTWCPGAEKE